MQRQFSSVKATELLNASAIDCTSVIVAGKAIYPNFRSPTLPSNAPAMILG